MPRTFVYCFTRETGFEQHGWHSLYPATLEAIERLGGEPIFDTAVEVDESALVEGRFFGAPHCAHRFHVTTFVTQSAPEAQLPDSPADPEPLLADAA